jgi:hypothetical protein
MTRRARDARHRDPATWGRREAGQKENESSRSFETLFPNHRRNGVKGFTLTLVALALVAGTALGQNNNPCPGEKEYQVNIIGVPKSKNPDMTGNNGRRIFVPLTGTTKIFMTGDTSDADGLQCGNTFQVTDANATDGVGKLVVPCENVNAESTDPGVCFDVWATPLGTPGGRAEVDVVCTFDDTVVDTDLVEGSCEDVPLGQFDFALVRGSGKPVQKDITNFMRASGCFDTDGSGTCDQGEKTFNNIWIFNLEALQEYFWEYDNQGLRVAMIRFCEGTDCGSFGVQP